MTTDPFASAADSPIAPAELCFAIEPSDVTGLPQATKAIYVGGAGDVTVRTVRADADVTFRNVPAGSILDIRVNAVRASGTSATDLVALA
jgi:hypothetical protein